MSTVTLTFDLQINRVYPLNMVNIVCQVWCRGTEQLSLYPVQKVKTWQTYVRTEPQQRCYMYILSATHYARIASLKVFEIDISPCCCFNCEKIALTCNYHPRNLQNSTALDMSRQKVWKKRDKRMCVWKMDDPYVLYPDLAYRYA